MQTDTDRGNACKSLVNGLRRFIRSESGFSLVEMLIAVSISLVVVLAVSEVFRNQRRSYTDQTETIEANMAMRSAMNFISRRVKMAGYSPVFGNLKYVPDYTTAPASFTIDVASAAINKKQNARTFGFAPSLTSAATNSDDQIVYTCNPAAPAATDTNAIYMYMDMNGDGKIFKRSDCTTLVGNECQDAGYCLSYAADGATCTRWLTDQDERVGIKYDSTNKRVLFATLNADGTVQADANWEILLEDVSLLCFNGNYESVTYTFGTYTNVLRSINVYMNVQTADPVYQQTTGGALQKRTVSMYELIVPRNLIYVAPSESSGLVS